MHCAGCEDRHHQAGQVQVRYDPDRVSRAEVEEQIRTAGYGVA